MPIRHFTNLLLSGALLLVASASLIGQEMLRQDVQIKHPQIPYSDPHSGEQMYKDYCAACHGSSGRGDGPAAAFMKTWPPDLTTMTQRNDGKFPEIKVRETLLFGTSSHAHGTSDMPIWGPLFRALDQNKKEVKERVSNLTTYVESLQRK